VVIPHEVLDRIVEQARLGAPEEVCGLLAGRDGIVIDAHPVTNCEHSPTFYRMDPDEQLRAVLRIEDDLDLEVLAIYHSHPATEPRPSLTDIRLAQWPGMTYIIVSLRNPDSPEIRSWSIEDGAVDERPITVQHPTASTDSSINALRLKSEKSNKRQPGTD
jgi:proteasome lid subunit RPN8/RPN11